ncbi:MAG: glycosyltransferase family 2 protein [Acidimicrobiia bacterium]|nr:glycosyltransferase family 2 protein [Acidimicrobiia bacterium]MDH3396713.1 glycosyltransferase family 2 protein [Acidimicrobiia bacterium]
MSKVDLSIVIPTYGGEDSIRALVSRLAEVAADLRLRHEVIIVNDASPDKTWEVLTDLASLHPELRGVDLLRNHGQAAATLCGLTMARGDLVATMDDDLQQPPEELPKLLDALLEHPDWDAVVGTWPRDDSPLRNLGSWLHQVVDRTIWGTPKGFRHTSFRLLRRPAVEALVQHETRTPVLGPLLLQATRRVHNVRVGHKERSTAGSGYTVRDGMAIVVNNLLLGSTLPLKLLARMGLAASLGAAILALGLVIRWAVGVDSPPGWASSLAATAFFGGAILFGLGVVGEYLMLIMGEVRRPPRWGVRRTFGEPGPET